MLANAGKCSEKCCFYIKYFDKIKCYADRPYHDDLVLTIQLAAGFHNAAEICPTFSALLIALTIAALGNMTRWCSEEEIN